MTWPVLEKNNISNKITWEQKEIMLWKLSRHDLPSLTPTKRKTCSLRSKTSLASHPRRNKITKVHVVCLYYFIIKTGSYYWDVLLTWKTQLFYSVYFHEWYSTIGFSLMTESLLDINQVIVFEILRTHEPLIWRTLVTLAWGERVNMHFYALYGFM